MLVTTATGDHRASITWLPWQLHLFTWVTMVPKHRKTLTNFVPRLARWAVPFCLCSMQLAWIAAKLDLIGIVQGRCIGQYIGGDVREFAVITQSRPSSCMTWASIIHG